MKGASVKKVILRFSSGNDPICHSQKFQPSQTPPSHFLPISPRFLTNIRCRYFSLNIWVVYDQLELDWCIFDQNWAKTRPLHFQIFQILNAIDRRIVHCIGHPARQLKLDKHRRTINISKDFRTVGYILIQKALLPPPSQYHWWASQRWDGGVRDAPWYSNHCSRHRE